MSCERSYLAGGAGRSGAELSQAEEIEMNFDT